MKNLISSTADYVGIAGSSLCLVHCLATPVLMVLRWYECCHFLEAAWWDYCFLLICFIAVFYTTRTHQSVGLVWAFWLAFVAFAVAILFEDDFVFAPYLGYGASSLLIIIHIFNIKFCKKCQTKNFQ